VHRRAFIRHSAAAAGSIGLVGGFGACKSGASKATESFVALRDRFFLDQLEHNPVTATYLGGDGYSPTLSDINGKLRDYSEGGLAQEVARLRSMRAALNAIDSTDLAAQDRIDAQVMAAQLDFVIRQIADRSYHLRSVDTYVGEPFRGIDWQIQQMTIGEGGSLGTEAEWQIVRARLDAIPSYLETARDNLGTGKRDGSIPDRRLIQRDGIAGSRANAKYFRESLPQSAKAYLGSQPYATSVLENLAAACASAAEACDFFATFLERTYDQNDRSDRFAAGEDEYAWRVKNVLRDPRSTSELASYGEQQVDLYTRRIIEVAEQVAREAKLGARFGTNEERRSGVRIAMDYLSKDYPKNDAELFTWYRETGERALAFGREHDLFDIPATYKLDVVETPPVLRSTIDAAYYPAPPFKKAGVGRFYLTPTEGNVAALKENNRASVADTAIHEGFPGHDWHYKYMTLHAREISNIRWLTPGAVEDSSSMWSDSMASEGWGLYSEELMADSLPGKPYGFYSPGEYLYELQGQLLRAVRIVVDVGLHTGHMTFDQALDYFAEHVSFYPRACEKASKDPQARAICDGATRAIFRYSKWPTQAITYNLGKNAIISLREAYKAMRGGEFRAKEFHQRLMAMGTIPAGYIREAFLR
jgi:uncharacterized protein (DUF885 family)